MHQSYGGYYLELLVVANSNNVVRSLSIFSTLSLIMSIFGSVLILILEHHYKRQQKSKFIVCHVSFNELAL